MLGKTHALGKWKTANSWQVVCNQSNARFTKRACRRQPMRASRKETSYRKAAVLPSGDSPIRLLGQGSGSV
jgi:hypothetical protein